MSFSSLLGQSLDIVTNTKTDTGLDITWAESGRVTTKGRLVQKSQEEIVDGRLTLVTSYLLQLGPDELIDAHSTIEYADEFAGYVFAVIGEPSLSITPRGPHHWEVALERVADLTVATPVPVDLYGWEIHGGSPPNLARLGQGFTVTAEGDLAGVTFLFTREGSPTDAHHVDIVAALSGTPIGSSDGLVLSGLVESSDPADAVSRTFVFDPAVTLTAGDYFFEIRRTDPVDTNNFAYIYVDQLNPTPGNDGWYETITDDVWDQMSAGTDDIAMTLDWA